MPQCRFEHIPPPESHCIPDRYIFHRSAASQLRPVPQTEVPQMFFQIISPAYPPLSCSQSVSMFTRISCHFSIVPYRTVSGSFRSGSRHCILTCDSIAYRTRLAERSDAALCLLYYLMKIHLLPPFLSVGVFVTLHCASRKIPDASTASMISAIFSSSATSAIRT